MKTLALGRPNTAFYGSFRHVLHHFGDVVFEHESAFEPPERIVDHVRLEGIDRVLMPNPYGNDQRLACYRALRAAGVTVVASDRGALPRAWFFDGGFNFDSETYQPAQWDEPLSPEEQAATRAYLEELRGSDAALETQGPRASRSLRDKLGLDPDARVLFVPLQRPKDTVVRHFAGGAGSLDGVVRRVEAAVRALEEEGERWNVVLKKHPLEVRRIPTGGHPRIRYAPDNTHVHDLIAASDAVITLNSGVGLLSLCFGKPTGCLGQAFYAHPGLAQSLGDAEADRAFLRRPAGPDADRVARFVHHLRSRVYSFGDFETDLVRDGEGAMQRITRHIEFDTLRVLGESFPVAGDRVVVVSPVIPTGIYRGSQSRVHNVLRAMIANGMRVSLAVLNTSFGGRASREITREIREAFPQLEHIEVRRHPKFDKSVKGRAKRAGARLVDAATLGTHRVSSLDACPQAFRRCVTELCAKVKPHFLFVNYAKLAPAIPAEFAGVRVIDTHDYQTQFLVEDQDRNGIRRHVNRHVYRASEHHALRQFDRLVAINPDERELFERIVSAPVHFLPAFSEEHPDESEAFWAHAHEALLVASMSNFNVKGLLWFAREVLPRVRAARPSFRLTVAGNIARAQEIREAGAALEGVDLLGIVPDLTPLYQQSACVVAPLLGGAGMKIKVVEALSFGKAIVATSKALDGIRAEDGVHLRRADAPTAFAEAIVRVLDEPAHRKALESGARALHRRDHGMDAARETLSEIFAR